MAGPGCTPARRHADRITLDCFGDQVVCHPAEMTVPDADEQDLDPGISASVAAAPGGKRVATAPGGREGRRGGPVLLRTTE